jgi:hypothetical protein
VLALDQGVQRERHPLGRHEVALERHENDRSSSSAVAVRGRTSCSATSRSSGCRRTRAGGRPATLPRGASRRCGPSRPTSRSVPGRRSPGPRLAGGFGVGADRPRRRLAAHPGEQPRERPLTEQTRPAGGELELAVLRHAWPRSARARARSALSSAQVADRVLTDVTAQRLLVDVLERRARVVPRSCSSRSSSSATVRRRRPRRLIGPPGPPPALRLVGPSPRPVAPPPRFPGSPPG